MLGESLCPFLHNGGSERFNWLHQSPGSEVCVCSFPVRCQTSHFIPANNCSRKDTLHSTCHGTFAMTPFSGTLLREASRRRHTCLGCYGEGCRLSVGSKRISGGLQATFQLYSTNGCQAELQKGGSQSFHQGHLRMQERDANTG